MIAHQRLPRRIHCVGIGGGGLSALAGLLAERGHEVSGSDTSDAFAVDDLTRRGISVSRGHDAGHLGAAELLIRSAAVPDSNPEVEAARARDVPVIKYSEALGRLMAGRRGVAVAGTHGKTTTTALVAHLLRACGTDPAWIVGGRPLSLPAAAGWGQGRAVVAEACEFDLSFLNLEYEVALVTGVAPDHLDCFGTPEAVRAAFCRFAERLPPGGTLVLGADAPGDLPLALHPDVRVWHVQDHLHLDRVQEDSSGFRGWVEGGAWGRGEFRLPLLGRHNLDNLRAALLSVLALDVPLWFVLPHVASFTGVARRLQDLGEIPLPGEAEGAVVRLIDDFAHHPDALRATAAALRARFPRRRLVGVFQPHQVSRTEDFMDGFEDSLGGFDVLGLCDIFVARDTHPERAEGVCASLAERLGERAVRLGPADGTDDGVLGLLQPGDVCAVMGAGDIDGLAGRLARAARRPRVG
ncbi:MAG: UDP-N-acetylmuramate--L-alanine ligase [Planctomycetota bacterium]|jgi:UDP-N-acetylmuramate--alanine ligase